MSKQIQLHCPSTKSTVENFIISPYQSPDQIYKAIRLALDVPHASLYTVAAVSITKLDSLQDGQRVLVAASRSEHMLPDSPLEYEFYDGQEADDVDPDLDGFGQEWDSLTEQEKCEHVMSLNQRKPTSRNKLRITREWAPVRDELAAIQETTAEHVQVAECEILIKQRWHTTIENFIPDGMKPPKTPLTSRRWDERVVAALGVLSSFTHGQAQLASELLMETLQMSMLEEVHTGTASGFVQLQDIVSTSEMVFKRAGVRVAKAAKGKIVRAKGKELRKAVKARKKEMGGVE